MAAERLSGSRAHVLCWVDAVLPGLERLRRREDELPGVRLRPVVLCKERQHRGYGRQQHALGKGFIMRVSVVLEHQCRQLESLGVVVPGINGGGSDEPDLQALLQQHSPQVWHADHRVRKGGREGRRSLAGPARV